MSKYGHKTHNWFEAIVNKLGGEEGAERFLRGEVTLTEPTRRFREQNGVIYFTLAATDGTTGPQWIDRLEKKGFRLSKWAKDVLNSKDFKPTKGIVNEIAVLKGMLFGDNNRITKKIRAEAEKRKLITPNAEVACMIREMFTDKEIEEMGLIWIIVMHEPINDSDGDPRLLYVNRDGGGQWVGTTCDNPDCRWGHEFGFAFVVQQVSTQA